MDCFGRHPNGSTSVCLKQPVNNTMSYFRLVTSRSFTETKALWGVHKLWTYLSVPLSGLVLRMILKGKTQVTGWQDVLLFTLFGFVVSWTGTYLINLIRAPSLIYHEQLKAIDALTAKNVALANPPIDPQEQRRRDFLAEIAKNLTPEGRRILQYVNDRGKIHRMSLMHVGGFNEQEVSHAMSSCLTHGLIHQTGPGMIETNPELKQAIEFVLKSC